jgi:hypothetical protein
MGKLASRHRGLFSRKRARSVGQGGSISPACEPTHHDPSPFPSRPCPRSCRSLRHRDRLGTHAGLVLTGRQGPDHRGIGDRLGRLLGRPFLDGRFGCEMRFPCDGLQLRLGFRRWSLLLLRAYFDGTLFGSAWTRVGKRAQTVSKITPSARELFQGMDRRYLLCAFITPPSSSPTHPRSMHDRCRPLTTSRADSAWALVRPHRNTFRPCPRHHRRPPERARRLRSGWSRLVSPRAASERRMTGRHHGPYDDWDGQGELLTKLSGESRSSASLSPAVQKA